MLASCGAGQTEETAALTDAATEMQEKNGIDTVKDMIEKLDINSEAAVAEVFSRFEALSFDERCQLTYEEYKKLSDAEYNLVNGALTADAENHIPEILAAVARAYFNQSYESRTDSSVKPQTQYDQYNYRRNFNATPEDATSQRALYLDCSSFVNSVYYFTFARNLLEVGKSVSTKNINADMKTREAGPDKELLYYITGDELAAYKANAADAAAFWNEVKSVLQPGDVINYYRADTGHVIMYLGDGKIIHSTGSANAKTSAGGVDPKTSIEKAAVDEAVYGTINIDDWDRFFTKTVTPATQQDGRKSTSNSYLFADNVTAIAIFRPADPETGRMRNSSLTPYAIARYLYDGLNIEKAATRQGADLYYGNSVYSGDEITFKVTVVNTSSKAMMSINAEEEIPKNLSFVSASDPGVYFADENKICFHVGNLGAGEKAEFTYVLKVNEGLAGGTDIEDSKTYVNSIRTNKLIYELAAVRIDSEKIEAAINQTLGTKFDNDIKAAAAVYAKLGIPGAELLNSFATPKAVINKYIVSNTVMLAAKDSSVLCHVIYGGLSVANEEITSANKSLKYEKVNTRLRRVLISNLEDGDIICAHSGYNDSYTAYIYYNHALYGLDASGAFADLDPSKLSIGTTVQDYLDTLTAYKEFLVLRPSLVG